MLTWRKTCCMDYNLRKMIFRLFVDLIVPHEVLLLCTPKGKSKRYLSATRRRC
jgi:hypothetical protein